MNSRSAPSSRLAVLRYRDFRLLWGAEVVSSIGSGMHGIATYWLTLQLLGSAVYHPMLVGHRLAVAAAPLALGVLGLVRILPVILLALVGGLLADSLDRRRIIMAGQALFALVSGALALLTLTGHIGVPALYALSAMGTAIGAVAGPAEQALVPHLAPRERLAQAYGLFSLLWQISTLAAPPLAGALIVTAGPGWVYAADALSFILVFLAARALSIRGRATIERPAMSWASVTEGMRFARGAPLIWSTLMIDLYATFFASARTMLPLVATTMLHAGALGYGILATAQPVGAALTGRRSRFVPRSGGRVRRCSPASRRSAWPGRSSASRPRPSLPSPTRCMASPAWPTRCRTSSAQRSASS